VRFYLVRDSLKLLKEGDREGIKLLSVAPNASTELGGGLNPSFCGGISVEKIEVGWGLFSRQRVEGG